MSIARISLPPGAFDQIVAGLLPPGTRTEEAVFAFAKTRTDGELIDFVVEAWRKVSPDGFTHRSPYYLELADTLRAKLIKEAHDRDCSLIEFHSHPLDQIAQFSPADVAGFVEFVPHILWRLKRRPYAAVVVARATFDALAWTSDVTQPVAVEGIIADGYLRQATGFSMANWEDYHHV